MQNQKQIEGLRDKVRQLFYKAFEAGVTPEKVEFYAPRLVQETGCSASNLRRFIRESIVKSVYNPEKGTDYYRMTDYEIERWKDRKRIESYIHSSPPEGESRAEEERKQEETPLNLRLILPILLQKVEEIDKEVEERRADLAPILEEKKRRDTLCENLEAGLSELEETKGELLRLISSLSGIEI